MQALCSVGVVWCGAVQDLDKAVKIVVDSKTDYPSACNAAETVLFHESLLKPHTPPTAGAASAASAASASTSEAVSGVEHVLRALHKAGVTLFVGPNAHKHFAAFKGSSTGSKWLSELQPAASLHHEYGDLTMAVEVVPSLSAAIDHIHAYGSAHTESIVTENVSCAEQFLSAVDSACVFHNASTRFADGFRCATYQR
jgi:gamma-glutamyl phosphate reductase